MSQLYDFIIVDDDPFNNILCDIYIKNTLGAVNVTTFEDAEKGLHFLENEFVHHLKPSILFLDINMPVLSGWDFMDQYENFDTAIKAHLQIYLVTSSVNPRDHERAAANKFIKGFISKPVEPEVLLTITKG